MCEVQRFADGARSDHVEGAGRESVHAAHGFRSVHITPDGIKILQERFSLVDALPINAIRQPEVLKSGTIRREGPMPDAQVTRFGADGRAVQTHKWRDIVGRAANFGNYRA